MHAEIKNNMKKREEQGGREKERETLCVGGGGVGAQLTCNSSIRFCCHEMCSIPISQSRFYDDHHHHSIGLFCFAFNLTILVHMS